MNNMKYYTNNLAYDFDLFMPKEKRPAEQENPGNIVRMPRKTESRKMTAKKAAASAGVITQKLSAILTSVLVLSMICLSIYLRVEITEVNDQISKAQTALAEQKSEETRLQMELERKISFKNIEQAAEAMGMQKKNRNQVVYIRTHEQNKTEASGGAGGIMADLQAGDQKQE